MMKSPKDEKKPAEADQNYRMLEAFGCQINLRTIEALRFKNQQAEEFLRLCRS